MLGNTLIDNSQNLKLVDTLNEIISIPEIQEICIATGYWDLKGTALITESLKKFLEKDETKLRLLIGKDPNVYQKDLTADSYKTAKQYPQDYIKIDLQNVELNNQSYQNAANLLMNYCNEEKKIEVHIFKLNEDDEKQFFHSKCYIFTDGTDDNSLGIVGSSNFTEKGLIGNSELNYLETNGMIVNHQSSGTKKGHIQWFNEKWALSEDWTKEFVVEIQNSPVGKEAKKTPYNPANLPPVADSCTVLTPHETYLKFLIDQFDEVVNFDGKITPDDYMPKDPDFKKLTYQKEAVNQGFAIMKRHHGFILADVVGLGKTFTALMVIKRHLIETGFKNPILIITPPAIKQSWIDSIEYFDKNENPDRLLKPLITLTTIGCLEDVNEADEYVANDDFDSSFKKSNYGMIVVDESHRFRNDGTIMYQKLDDLIGSIAPQPYVVLLSATPQNNAPYDLRNQIYLFQREHNNSTLDNLGSYGNKLESYFYEKQQRYKTYISKEKFVDGKKVLKTKEELERDKAALKEDSEDIRRRIVEPLVIRRTRTDIECYYTDDMKNQGLSFPKIQKPVAIPYEMKGDLGNLFNQTINIIAPQVSHVDTDEEGQPVLDFGATAGDDGLGYYRYRAIEYLKAEKDKKRHETRNLTAEGTSQRLAQIMELLLVKRLESSQAAFKESLHNLHRYSENMLKMWEKDRIFICPDIDVNKELDDENISKNGGFEQCLTIIADKAKKANKRNSGDENDGPNQEYKRTDFIEEYIDKLNNDLRLIDELCSKWDVLSDDPKMETFIRKLDSIMEAAKYKDKDKNTNQKLVIFTECIATQEALVKKFQNCASEYKILSITAKNRDDKREEISANFDANYKGTKKDDYQILITTDVLAEGVNLHRANSILNYDSPWNATRLMQRLGRINRIGTEAKKIWNYNFYPSTLGDNQINLKNRTYVKLQAFHELFGEDSQIYSTEEEVKHFDKVEHEELEDAETPIMPFIAELRNFKSEKPNEYEALKKITGEVVSTIENDEHLAFASLHELDKAHNLIQSNLYIGKDTGSAKKVGQLEFFETLKPLSHNEGIETDYELNEKYKISVLNCYASDKQNAQLSMKSKIRTGEKEKATARKKIKALYNIENLNDETFDKLDEICNSIEDGNHSLINKIINMDFTNDGLGNIKIESDVEYLYKFTRVQNENVSTELAIEFVAK